MTNVQTGIIAGAIVVAGAFIGLGISGARKEPAPKERAQSAVDFVDTVAKNFQTVSETVKIEMTRTVIIELERNLQLYAQDHAGEFPAKLDALETDPKKYVSSVESDMWGRAYAYTVGAGDSKTFSLHSLGPDGLDGTADDIYAKAK